MYSDSDPLYDVCSKGTTIAMGGRNIGDLLNAHGITWGWFEGGFQPDVPGPHHRRRVTVCTSAHKNISGASVTDYSPHHEPFQYYPQTANPQHLPPTSIADDRAPGPGQPPVRPDRLLGGRHARQPARGVSFLKAPRYQDGHAGYSDPLDEQHFLVNTINSCRSSTAGRTPRWW